MRTALLFLIILPFVVLAETAYITDKLRLGLHEAADTSDRAFRTLESGQELEIISRDRNYARIRLPDGEQGHVKAAYLVSEKPARLIVSEMRSSNENFDRKSRALKPRSHHPLRRLKDLNSRLPRTKQRLMTAWRGSRSWVRKTKITRIATASINTACHSGGLAEQCLFACSADFWQGSGGLTIRAGSATAAYASIRQQLTSVPRLHF